MTDHFLDAALVTGRRIASQAMWSGGVCTWEVVVPQAGKTARALAGGGLYQGTAGVAVFLAELVRCSPDREVRRAAEGALRHSLAQHPATFRTRMGCFDGVLGSAWASIRAGEALGGDEFVERGLALADELARGVSPDGETDVLAGAAGAIPLLLAIAARPGGEACAAAATVLGDWLLEVAVPEVWGWSWPSPGLRSLRNLVGFAHGASGPTHALLALSAATGEARFGEGARQGLAYERRFFDRTRGGWPDFRTGVTVRDGGPPSGSASWCTGAAGIGLVRVRAWQLLGWTDLQAEARAATQVVRARLERPWEDYSLCHGVAGAVDFLVFAAEALGEPPLRRLAEELGARMSERCGAGDWPCGTADRSPDASLMLGESGIGHGFLRLASPAVESVLLPPTPTPTADASVRLSLRGPRRHFGRSLAGLEALLPRWRFAVEREAGAAAAGEEVLRTRRALARLAAAPGEDGRASLLPDLLRLDLARYAAALDPFAEPFPPPARRTPQWESEWMAPAPGVRVVASDHDWDGWLERPPEDRGDAPLPGPSFHLLQRAGGEVRTVKLLPFAGLAFLALEGGARLEQAAERVRASLDGDAPAAAALTEPLKRQLGQLYALGAIQVTARDPLETAVADLQGRLRGGSRLPAAGAAGAVIRRVLEGGAEEMGREDGEYAGLRMESDAAQLRQALRALYLGEHFRDLLDDVEAARGTEERRSAYGALLDELRLVAGSPSRPLVAEL